ncbi:ABC transporter ATP-binding protein [Acetobacter vaccinii]|uniref:ABC transporter ATP-binding protein n=1 Tax=Acetobacter vaccinii TaxID=2592655 RepID=A0A5C1YPW1_9PROT|nr:ABC transporter ATP-binding protein [Acetobacter vaccinii]QEO16832.1 ABC transporter ATP-binding protein [Acetobacter vaccinii]
MITKRDGSVAQDVPPGLSYAGVCKRYGQFTALDGISLDVGPREFVTLLGPSGSGKSTLLGLAVGSIEADAGHIAIRGVDVRRLKPHDRNIGMVFQRYSLFPNKTVEENIAYPLQIRKIPKPEVAARVAAIVQTMGLGAQAARYPAEISGGQAQRVAVARALVFNPDLLLMDEPLGALDKRLRADLQQEIRRLQHEFGIPTLYVTHDQDEAMYLSDRIALFNHGRIVALGTPRELYENPASAWEASFLGDANLFAAEDIRISAGECSAVLTGLGVAVRTQAPRTQHEHMQVMIRPEYVHIGDNVRDDMTRFKARVIDVIYLGARQRVTLELPGAIRLIAELRPWETPGEPGAEVLCGWRDHHSRVVEA